MRTRPDTESAPQSSGAISEVRSWYLVTKQVADRLASLIVEPVRPAEPGFIIEDANLPYYVKFAWNALGHVLTCEATANGNLEPSQRLSDEQQSALRSMGWHPPGRGDAGSSQNFVRIFYAPKDTSVAASLAISALATTYRADPRRLRWRTS